MPPAGKAEWMSTKAELEAEVERLTQELEAARAGRPAPSRPAPVAPSFGICAGVAADLETNGKALDPFTGETLTGGMVDGRLVVDEPAGDEGQADDGDEQP